MSFIISLQVMKASSNKRTFSKQRLADFCMKNRSAFFS